MSEESPQNFDVPKNDSEKTITLKKSTYTKMIAGVIAAIAIAAFFGGYAIGTMEDSDSLTNEDVADLLLEIQEDARDVPQPTQIPQPAAPQIIQVSLDDDPVKGNPNAPITIVEFSDFQCPFCSRFYQQTLPQIEQNYIATGKAKLVYRDMPLDNLHPNARPAHIASECADEQGKFWDYHDVLFEKQREWQRLGEADLSAALTGYASDLGLQSESFGSCMSDPEIAKEVNADLVEAGRYGATGTPTFFIGNEKDGFVKLVGAQPYVQFQNVIESQLG